MLQVSCCLMERWRRGYVKSSPLYDVSLNKKDTYSSVIRKVCETLVEDFSEEMSNYAYTVSLIIDQHHSLQEHGFRVTYLGSLQTDSSIHSKIAQADYEILLSTPESFYDEFGEPKSVFKTLCLQKKIGLIAIDEAHLIHSWASF